MLLGIAVKELGRVRGARRGGFTRVIAFLSVYGARRIHPVQLAG